MFDKAFLPNNLFLRGLYVTCLSSPVVVFMTMVFLFHRICLILQGKHEIIINQLFIKRTRLFPTFNILFFLIRKWKLEQKSYSNCLRRQLFSSIIFIQRLYYNTIMKAMPKLWDIYKSDYRLWERSIKLNGLYRPTPPCGLYTLGNVLWFARHFAYTLMGIFKIL